MSRASGHAIPSPTLGSDGNTIAGPPRSLEHPERRVRYCWAMTLPVYTMSEKTVDRVLLCLACRTCVLSRESRDSAISECVLPAAGAWSQPDSSRSAAGERSTETGVRKEPKCGRKDAGGRWQCSPFMGSSRRLQVQLNPLFPQYLSLFLVSSILVLGLAGLVLGAYRPLDSNVINIPAQLTLGPNHPWYFILFAQTGRTLSSATLC
jgi:hypothetical protein